MKTRPFDPRRRGRSAPRIHILRIIQSGKCETPTPHRPPSPINQTIQIRLHKHSPRILLPRPPQEALEPPLHAAELRRRPHAAVRDRDPRVLIRIAPPLRRYHVGLVLHRPPHEYVAVLQHRRRVAKDEVHRAVDATAAVELPQRVDEEGVLVALHAASVEHRPVRSHSQCDGLVLCRPGRVLERHVSGPEPIARDTCTCKSSLISNIHTT